jgi:predicted DNA-binding transcriptional regulator AlpA
LRSHSFTVIASGPKATPEDLADRFFDAGCDDATVSVQKGVTVLEFDRVARTFVSALLSAVRDVRRAGATVERIEPDPLVSASDIALRTGLGRAAISLYASGARGSGFPHPVARVTTESPLWDWAEVSSWMHRRKKLALDVAVHARVVREVNRIVSEESSRPPMSKLRA